MDPAKRKLIVISAPSGSGKTTICRELQRIHPDWKFSVSCTTRPRREYEKNGFDYEFVSEEEFKRRIDNGELVEYEDVHGYFYGTPRKTVELALQNGQTLLLDVDVKGGITIQDVYPENTVTVFIRPPSIEELKRRLKGRGSDSEGGIQKRLDRMDMEMSYESIYDFSIVNENIDRTVRKIVDILEYHKTK